MFNIILKKLAASLNKMQVPYMVIGGQAVLLYGEPRLTKDIDITFSILFSLWGRMVLVKCSQIKCFLTPTG